MTNSQCPLCSLWHNCIIKNLNNLRNQCNLWFSRFYLRESTFISG